jgi:hypothetical protein
VVLTTMASPSCITFGGIKVDRVVACEVIYRIQPLGIARQRFLQSMPAVTSIWRSVDRSRMHCKQRSSRLLGRNGSSTLVDPDNRLVADELERRWSGLQQ